MKQTDQIHQIDQIGQMFWDIDPKKLDIIRHKRFIMERISQYGTPPEISWLLDTYKKKDIIQVVKQSKNIDRKTANYWTLYFDIPREMVLCLNRSLIDEQPYS